MDHPRLKKNVTGMLPEQIDLALSAEPTSLWISWVTGDAQIGTNVKPLDPSSVASEVWYGKESGNYTGTRKGVAAVYSQLYPFEGLQNYTSGIIHHVRLEEPGMEYYFKCGDSPIPAMRNEPSLVLVVGDLSYANQYRTTGGNGSACFSCTFPDALIRETYQPRWDRWGRFMEPLISSVPMMVVEGNHEIEPQVDPPWLVAAWHPPWYNSYSSHYQEFECMRQEMESLLYQYKVDIVFSGHVHAYERMNRVYNYTLDPCGLVYITVGDGGNIEKVDVDYADDPGKCPSPGDNLPDFGGVCHLKFSSGPAKGKFCWDRQPEWSAYRESSFGHGILEVVNSTHALWTWHRNQDAYKEDKPGDQIFIVRQPKLCPAVLKDESGQPTQAPGSSRVAALSMRYSWLMLSVIFTITILIG